MGPSIRCPGVKSGGQGPVDQYQWHDLNIGPLLANSWILISISAFTVSHMYDTLYRRAEVDYDG